MTVAHDLERAAANGDDLGEEKACYFAEQFSLLHATALLTRIGLKPSPMVEVEAVLSSWVKDIQVAMEDDAALHPIAALQQVLFDGHGLRGDSDDYDNPTNSFLGDIVVRKRGLPIMLSLVLVEVATRIGLDAWMVPVPGHVMAAVTVPSQGFVVMDAFAGGELVKPEDLAERVGLPESELGSVLLPADDRSMLWRMLGNLQRAYGLRSDTEGVLRVLHRKVLLRDADVDARIQRAEVLLTLHHGDWAQADCDRARSLAHGDVEMVRRIDAVEGRIAKLQTLN